MNKKWERSFAEGWDELHESQRYEQAKYIVEFGIDEGATIADIARATQRSEHPVSESGVSRYLDLYGVNKCRPGGGNVNAGHRRLTHAMNQYKDVVNVSTEDVEEYAEEHGYSKGVAARLLRGEEIGKAMAKDGMISKDGELRVSDPRTQQPVEGRNSYEPVLRTPNAFQWTQRFTRHSGQLDEFLTFLRATKQDSMSDKVIAPRLRRMAEQLERQADRFATGYEKCAAKTRAKTSKGV